MACARTHTKAPSNDLPETSQPLRASTIAALHPQLFTYATGPVKQSGYINTHSIQLSDYIVITAEAVQQEAFNQLTTRKCNSILTKPTASHSDVSAQYILDMMNIQIRCQQTDVYIVAVACRECSLQAAADAERNRSKCAEK